MNCTTKRFFFSILVLVSLFAVTPNCKKSDRDAELQKIINNKEVSDEEALYGIAKIIFSDTLKSFKSERNSSDKLDVVIEYGGNRAFTFHSEENYSEKIQFDVVRLVLLYFQSGVSRNLNSLRISLVKPYFVKEPDAKKEVTAEFEIFRVSINLDDLKKVSEWDNPKYVSDKRSANNSKIIEHFNQVRLNWKIEMNELYRIELK